MCEITLKNQTPENIRGYVNHLVSQLAEDTIDGLQIIDIGDAEGTHKWDYDVTNSEVCNRGDCGWFPSALEALLDFTLYLKECNCEAIQELCTLEDDI